MCNIKGFVQSLFGSADQPEAPPPPAIAVQTFGAAPTAVVKKNNTDLGMDEVTGNKRKGGGNAAGARVPGLGL